jgi:hypothetical protein
VTTCGNENALQKTVIDVLVEFNVDGPVGVGLGAWPLQAETTNDVAMT